MPSVIHIHFLLTCRPLCNIGIHLITLSNILMPKYYQFAHLNACAKCHEVTLMVIKVLIISVTCVLLSK